MIEQTPQLPSDFVARLENWGEYYRDRKRPGKTATYDICEAMADRAGQTFRESVPRHEVDAEDAQIIEYCWRMCGHRVHARDRAILRAYYVERVDPRGICRVLHVRWRSFPGEHARAVLRFRDAVALLERVGYSPPQDNPTTVANAMC
ncbi:hypothetical protein N5K27_22490 [Pigmentiphaga sp. GD03639]|uniref:hypothetical protein n=1 Tax=Pigmentiphaga sp. GD03639 TaxID=2975354 RepID=UPI00244A79AC|nr:hypothetical protein [Pigmentiphaga sp. GD03639]MDH2239081.1 hypothetical protein [Pigmentiphaga sp. GD03639]